MRKTFVGPNLRKLRREHKQTQAEMAEMLGVSAAYVNLLENNQRSLSVKMLVAVSDAYQVEWRELVNDESSTLLADLRSCVQDPIFGGAVPDLQELRAALDHAPVLVDQFLRLYRNHRATLDRLTRQGSDSVPEDLLVSSPEAIIHDFFRNRKNHFPRLEAAAEALRDDPPCAADDVYGVLKARLSERHRIRLRTLPVEEMSQALRVYNAHASEVLLSEALDHPNRVFQLAHVLCLVELPDLLEAEMADSGIVSETGLARCRVELANYFAAAVLMPYAPFLETAERTNYDVDRIAAAFGVSFEQVCHRLTTLQRQGRKGVPFHMLRVDMILADSDGKFRVLEANSMPGFTATSLFPKAAAAAGIPFQDLCVKLVQLASESGTAS